MKKISLHRSLTGLACLLTGLALAAGLTADAHAQTNDGQWLGINAPYYSNLNPDLADLGIKAVRLGSSWQQSGKPDEMRYRDDAKISSFAAAGHTIHMVVPYRGYDFNNKKIDVADFETWVANYKDLCRQTITKYGSPGNVKVPYYICGNEPDLNEVFSGNLTAYQAYRFSRALWEAKNEINASLTVESSPVSSPETTYLRDMINAGVADYTDVIGVHAYGSQFDEGRLSKPWEYLAAAGKSKPVSISESGVPLGAGWGPSGVDENLWRTRWHQLAYVQAKRYGYDRMLLFTHTGDTDWTDKWDYRDRKNNNAPVQGAYDEVKYGMRKRTNLNGGFESDNDRWHEWVVMQSLGVGPEATWANFTSGGAHSGSRCLNISVGGEWRQVRKVVSDLTVGTPYTLSAWVKTVGGGGARLKAFGYNHANGTQEASASASATSGTWEKLTVNFTPTNPWVVISLVSTGSASSNVNCYFDDVSLTGGPTITDALEDGAIYNIYSTATGATGRVWDVAGGATANNSEIQIYDGSNHAAQQWRAVAVAGGKYEFVPQNATDKALSVRNGASSNGSLMVINSNTHAANQQFSLTEKGGGVFDVAPSNASTKRIHLVSSQTSNGTRLHLWDNAPGAVTQNWRFTKVASNPTISGTYRLVARHSGKALTVESYSTTNGANVIQYGTDSALNRQWIITPTDNGFSKLVAKHSGKAMEVASSGTINGSNVQQWDYVNIATQQWKIESVGGGYYKLTNRNSGKALDVAGGESATQDGVNVQQRDYIGQTNQQWVLEQISSSTSALRAPAPASKTSAPATASSVPATASSAPSGGRS